MAQHHIFLALSSPSAGREVDFHIWYDAHHLQDVVDFCPGFERGQRYWAAAEQPGGEPLSWPSLAVYELEGDDVAQLHRDVKTNIDRFTPSDGVFEDGHVAWVYSPGDFDGISASGDKTMLMLAFGNERPVDTGLEASWILERHADQREGNTPPWRYLRVARLPEDSAAARARAYMGTGHAEAVWLYQAKGARVVARRPAGV